LILSLLSTTVLTFSGEAYAIIKSSKGKKGMEEDLQLANILIEVAQELKRGIKNDPDHLKVWNRMVFCVWK
jgi:hypothetical protein